LYTGLQSNIAIPSKHDGNCEERAFAKYATWYGNWGNRRVSRETEHGDKININRANHWKMVPGQQLHVDSSPASAAGSE
jgi:hypothetical protein